MLKRALQEIVMKAHDEGRSLEPTSANGSIKQADLRALLYRFTSALEAAPISQDMKPAEPTPGPYLFHALSSL